MFDILSWNIRQGGGSRLTKIVKSIEELKPEVVALSEYRNNKSGIQLRTSLLRLGYRYQVVSHAERDVNSAIFASRYPCSQSIFPKCDENYDHSIVCGRLPVFDIYSVYFPHKKKHKLFEFLIEDELKPDRPAIIVGDYNTGKNHIDQVGNSFWYTDQLIDLEKLGYVDAFRHVHGDVKEYSWFSHQGNGYRYDHSYVSEALLPFIADCKYLHEWREAGLSDHSPMVLTLKV